MLTQTSSWVGQVLGNGRYRVVAKLGEGGMGFVYRARDLHLDNQDVVIKVPRPAMLEDPEFAGRFAREIRSLVRLTHPQIVRVTDAGEHEGLPFAVMQYLSGGSLRDRQQTGPDGQRLALPPEELHAWLPGVAAALDFMHQRHYIHRDVKPDNILFDEHGHVYLSDFGIAKALADNAAPKPATVHTGTGMVLGTPPYMAPELIMGERCDGRVDQFALAVTVYELLSGRLPADGPTPMAILVQQTTKTAVPLAELVPTIKESLSLAVQKSLSRDPNERYSTCSAFAQAALEGVPKTAAAPSRRASSAGGARATPDGATPAYKVSCPKCRKLLVLRAASQGKRVRCSSCGEVFQAPAVSAAALTRSAPAFSETGRAEEARLDTRTAASTSPSVPLSRSAAGAESPGQSSWGNIDRSLPDIDPPEGSKTVGYLFPAIGLAAALGLLGVCAVLVWNAKNRAPKVARVIPSATKPTDARPDQIDPPKQEQPSKSPPSPPPVPPSPPPDRQRPAAYGANYPPPEKGDGPSSEPAAPLRFVPKTAEKSPFPEDTAMSKSNTDPLPESPPGGRRARVGGPDKPLKDKMKAYIRKNIASVELKFESWPPPVWATRGEKEGLLYTVGISSYVANLSAQGGRQHRNYYLFVEGEHITAGGSDADKICKIIKNP